MLPQTDLAEVAYLTGREAGVSVVAAFLRGLSASRFCLTELTDNDLDCISDTLDKYAGSRIDFVDASVMAVAERSNITTVLTPDQRDFRLYCPHHCSRRISVISGCIALIIAAADQRDFRLYCPHHCSRHLRFYHEAGKKYVSGGFSYC